MQAVHLRCRLTFRPLSTHLLKNSCSKSGTNKLHEKSKGPVNTYTHSRRNTHNLPHPLIQAQLQYSRRGHTSESIGPHVNTSSVYFRTGRRIILGKRIDTPFWYQLVYCLIRAQGGEGFLLRFIVIVPITTFMVDQFPFNSILP